MAVRIQIRRDTSANWTSNNPVLYPGEIGFETDTKKFKIGPAVTAPTVATAWNSISGYANVVPSDLSNTLDNYILAADLGTADGPAKLNVDGNLLIPEDSIIFEGATANDFETTLTVADPTADRTITLPDVTGTVITTGNLSAITSVGTLTSPLIFEGATADEFETTLVVTDPTSDRVITFPDLTGTVVLRDTFETLTNKTITSPVVSGLTLSDSSIVFEGATANDFETTFTVTDPTADRTITFPDASGTLAFTSDLSPYAPLAGATFTGAVSATDLTLSGNLTVNGTTTNINSTDLVVEDKNIVIGDTATPSDATADGGGITLKGTTDKTFNWVDATDAWTSSEHVNLASGKSLYLNGTLLKDVTETLTNKTLTSPKINEDVAVTATATELNYVDGVTSAIQTQLDGKVDESLFDAKGDLLVASADNTPAKLTVGTNGYLLTANSSATNGIEWAAAPVSLPSQTGNSGYYLTTDGTNASWGALVVPITTGTATVTVDTATTVDTTALSAFTSIEYMVSLKQGSKVRTSKVVFQTDGTSVDMTEFAITETGGSMSGVVVSATTASTNAVLQVTVTDASGTNVTVKFSKVAL